MDAIADLRVSFNQMIADVKVNVTRSVCKSVSEEIDAQANALFEVFLRKFSETTTAATGTGKTRTSTDLCILPKKSSRQSATARKIVPHLEPVVILKEDNVEYSSSSSSNDAMEYDGQKENEGGSNGWLVWGEEEEEGDVASDIECEVDVYVKDDESDDEPEHHQQPGAPALKRRKTTLNTSTAIGRNSNSLLASRKSKTVPPMGLKKRSISQMIEIEVENQPPEAEQLLPFKTVKLSCLLEDCTGSFLDLLSLNEHLDVDHGILPYRCLHLGCDCSFKFPKGLTAHQNSMHPKPNWKCLDCGLVLKDSHTLHKHAYWNHHPGVFACIQEDCPQTSSTRAEAKKHSHIHLANVCDDPSCGKAFRDFDSLRRHQRTHSGARPFVCLWPGCTYNSARRDHLVKHIRHIHFGQSRKGNKNSTSEDPTPYIRIIKELL